MMREAVKNDRLAANQRLADAYRTQLQSASEVVSTHWQADLDSIQGNIDLSSPASSFANIVSMGKCDSVVVGTAPSSVEGSAGSYPSIDAEAQPANTVFDTDAWRMARKQELSLIHI